MNLVLDANIVVAGLRSPKGASAELLRQVLGGKIGLLLSVALVLEYEAVCVDPEQRASSGLSEAEVEIVINALCTVAIPVDIHFLWRPQLSDPADEMVLEAAIAGHADGLVTFNQKDFGNAPARFGIDIVTPQQVLERLRQ